MAVTFPGNPVNDRVYDVAGRQWIYKRNRGWVPYNRIRRLNNPNFAWEILYTGVSSQSQMNEVVQRMMYEATDVLMRHFNGNDKSLYEYDPDNYIVFDGNSGYSVDDSSLTFSLPEFDESDSFPDSDFISPF